MRLQTTVPKQQSLFDFSKVCPQRLFLLFLADGNRLRTAYLEITQIYMLCINLLADVRISQQKCDLQLRLLSCQSCTHCRSKRATTKNNNFLCSIQGCFILVTVSLEYLGPAHEVPPKRQTKSSQDVLIPGKCVIAMQFMGQIRHAQNIIFKFPWHGLNIDNHPN